MQNEGDYQVIITHEGVLVFLIKTRFRHPKSLSYYMTAVSMQHFTVMKAKPFYWTI